MIAAAVVGLALSAGAWYAAVNREDSLAQDELKARANDHALLLQSGIKRYVGTITAIHALFESRDNVPRSEFQAFSDALLKNQSAILAVSWIPRVKGHERVEHERQAEAQGLTGYHIKSVGADGGLSHGLEKPEYYPVYYSSAEPVGSPVYGLDLADGGVRQQTLERARLGDQIATSGTFVLQRGEGDRKGFFMVMPVYRPGVSRASGEAQRDDLIGFVQGVFQTGVLIETILRAGSVPAGLDLYFYGSEPAGGQPLIYFHPSRARKGAAVAPLPRPVVEAAPHWSEPLVVGDRKWTLVAASIPGGPGTPKHFGSWAVLATALLVTGLVTGYIWSLGRFARRVQAANRRLDEQNVRFETAVSNMSQGLLLFDPEGRIVMHNHRYAEMYGLPPEIMTPGRSLRDLLRLRKQIGALPADLPDDYFEELLAAIKRGESLERVTQLPDGRTIVVVNHPIAGGGWVATHEDITERLKAEAKISHLARHDVLTDLPNRVLFHDTLDHALKHPRDEKVAVLCLDIDHFKGVNDTLGHHIGDMLLKAVAGRLQNSVRDSDAVARLGGDEFAIVQIGASQPTDATILATRLIDEVGAPYDLAGHHVVVGTSIGIAIAPGDGNDPDQLLKAAGMALQRAKGDGRGVFRFFEAEMDARMQARQALQLDLHRAVAEHQFELVYQPLIEVRTGRIRAFEALLRWRHPQRGVVLPSEFIPLAESTGLIAPIGEWVLRQACKDATSWPDDVSVAANLSPVQFKNRNLLSTVVSALAAAQLAPSRLELEITESLLLQESPFTLTVLHQLRSLGVRTSMDDFGTGYSSLAYLQKFPFDKIKIDKSFVRDMMDREDSLAIVRAIAAIGASLGMMITAEGVETVAQFELLKAEGCNEVQGYLFSPPRPVSEIPDLLHKHNAALKAIA